MSNKDSEKRISLLQQHVELLQKANVDLINRNLQLAQQVDAFYDVRRRVMMLKELVIRHQELLKQADTRDDDELMALIETLLEQGLQYENPDFGLKDVAELANTTQTRVVDMFRRSHMYRSVNDYLEYLRLLRSMYYLRQEPAWSIAACARQAGFSVIRTYNRKFLDAIGMTPHEFRLLLEEGRSHI